MRTRFAGIWFISVLLGLVRAYTIDDSKGTPLTYLPPSRWVAYGVTGEQLSLSLPDGTTMAINSAQCFDGTFTYAACTTDDFCILQFAFTGSGITVYVLQAGPQGMSASLWIDTGPQTEATLDAPPPPQYNIPNIILFDMQGLSSGSHVAAMWVLDWNGSFSGMMLDYIDVNETQVGTASDGSTTGSSPSASDSSSSGSVEPTSAPPLTNTSTTSLGGTASSTSSPPSSSTSSPSSPKKNVAALAGGTVGGILGLIGLCALVVYLPWRRRRSRSRSWSQSRSRSFGENIAPLMCGRSSGSRLSNDGGGGGGGTGVESQDVEGAFARGPSLAFVSSVGGQPVSTLDRPSTSVASEGNREHMGGGARTSAGMRVSDGSAGAIAASRGSRASRPLLRLVSAVASAGAAGTATSPAKVIVLAPEDESVVVAATQTSPRLPASMTGVAQVPAVNTVRRQVNPYEKTDGVGASAPVLEAEAGVTADMGAWATGEAGARSGPGAGIGVVPRTAARSRQVLSGEQADLVAELYQSNVPVPVVAHLLERMIMSSGGGGGGGGFNEGDGDTTVSTAPPPSYDSAGTTTRHTRSP